MYTVVDDIHTVNLVLRVKVCIKALLNVLHDWPPGIIVVNEVTEARCIDHRQA